MELRISKQAQILLEQVVDIDMEDFKKWFYEESDQTIVGSGTITAYFVNKNKNYGK